VNYLVTDIKKYKQEKKKEKKLTLLSRFLIFLFKFLVIAGLIIAIIIYVPVFKVAEAQVTGLFYLEKNSLDNQLEDIKGENIIFLNKKKIGEAFLANSYIKEVDISRKFPNKILVQVKERAPVALLVTTDGFIQLSEDSVFLDIRQTPGSYNLPLITGIELYAIPGVGKKIESPVLEEALKIISGSNRILTGKIAEINIDNERIIAYTRNGITVLLGGAEDIDNKLKILEGIMDDIVDVTISVSEIEHIDLRFKDTYVIKRIQD
jgi:cell division protein FtsQ